jgi:hypothetical protein
MRPAASLIALFMALLTALLAGCQPAPANAPRLEITPFPTMTPGRVLRAPLLSADTLPEGQLNPATAVAIAVLPTATPDLFTCPPLSDDATLEATPPQNPPIIIEEITRYLRAGGSFATLAETLDQAWGVLGEGGIARDDIDLTGEGRGEFIVSYAPPGGRGTLLILGCVAGTVELLYEAESDLAAPPALLTLGDMNRDRRNDLLFSARRCPEGALSAASDEAEACQYLTRLLTWNAREDRFVNLLTDDLLTFDAPEAADVDQDEVSEVVVRLENRGTQATGPLRTGLNVYDWDGTRYVLSIAQYDAPRFKIQVLHEADRAFERGDLVNAIALYNVALNNPDLRFWFNDEVEALRSYALYKLLVVQTQAGGIPQIDAFQLLISAYPDLAAGPVYAALAQTFLTTFQTSAAIGNACAEVVSAINQRPEALDLLNRYGSQSPTYTARDLCPF